MNTLPRVAQSSVIRSCENYLAHMKSLEHSIQQRLSHYPAAKITLVVISILFAAGSVGYWIWKCFTSDASDCTPQDRVRGNSGASAPSRRGSSESFVDVKHPYYIPEASSRALNDHYLSDLDDESSARLQQELISVFGPINSHGLQKPPIACQDPMDIRTTALTSADWPQNPVVVSRSFFVPARLADAMMRCKKESALGVKFFSPSDKPSHITNMEGALHTFVTPITPIFIGGDYRFNQGHGFTPFEEGNLRQVVLSAAVQPDFETPEVMMHALEAKEKETQGESLPQDFLQLREREFASQEDFLKAIPDYDERLRRHMIYHLVESHKIPAKGEIAKEAILDSAACIDHLETQLGLDADEVNLEGLFLRAPNGSLLSLEALLNTYYHQLENEFAVFQSLLTQGYVYTIDPPSIFTRALGRDGQKIVNRLQLLAFKLLLPEDISLAEDKNLFRNCVAISFNDFADPDMIDHYKAVFNDDDDHDDGIPIFRRSELYSGDKGALDLSIVTDKLITLVLHNNSDAFGRNIETEPYGDSLDGVIGAISDGAKQLCPRRDDFIFLQGD